MLAALLLALAIPGFSATEVHIKLNGKGSDARLTLGLGPFGGEDAGLAKEIRDAVRSDLLLSRHFILVEEGDFKAQGAGWTLAAKISSAADQVTISARLTDIATGDAVLERYYRQDARFKRSAAHRLADDVVRQLTGRPGIAHTQIAFSSAKDGHKELWLVDYDGENLRQLTRHGSISILPRFAPDRKTLAYTSFKDGNPDLYLLSLETGKTRVGSKDQGLNVAGGFSPDGNQLLMTLSRQKSPNLYLKNLGDGTVTQLTQHFGADSSPTFSPDAQQVAFVSDRAGNPQIYILDLTTRRAKRLTNMNWCDSPSWSPTGEWVAFAGRANSQDKLDIFIVDVTGGQVRQLTRGEGSNENPSWSPDGRFLAFTTTRRGKAELYVMDADGSAPHRIVEVPGAVGTPDWSR